MPPKRKISGTTAAVDMQPPPPPLKKRASSRINSVNATVANPDVNPDVVDAPNATRASPDVDVNDEIVPGPVKDAKIVKEESPLSDVPEVAEPPKKKARGRNGKAKAADEAKEAEDKVGAVVDAAAGATNGQPPAKKGRGKKAAVKQEESGDAKAADEPVKPAAAKAAKKDEAEAADPEGEGVEEAGEEEIQEALARPPPVNSDYLPLPWKGRLGYACLNTYLRQSNPPVFSSRTCRIASILEHRHPLRDPSQPEHATKNRPDKTQPADVERGMRYVQDICLANVYDINKMIRWNDKYNIRFLRLSSEMFPFASHSEYGYKLAPFASEALAEAGRTIAKYGHRVTTHPGQFTQLGSPRKPVIENALRDLEYHDEMLSLLKLPEQQNKDAVMIMHMGGLFEGKAETLARFRENYVTLSQSVKNRLVLENDDVIWTTHDLLPVCEELNIPFVLDYHHHNILFDSDKIREGTKDIIDLYPRITATWKRKGITQKMHYSEPTPPAITGRQRRKHNPRPATLPPCAQDMDLMIEAKDKEQAVFELMKTFKLPGFDTFNDILPYTRRDDNKSLQALAAAEKKKAAAAERKAAKGKKAVKKEEDEDDDTASVASTADTNASIANGVPDLIPDEDVGMGGPEGRVYWPPGMEEWLRPKKREVKKKDPAEKTPAQIKKEAEKLYADAQAKKAATTGANGVKQEVKEESESDVDATPATKKAKAAMRKKDRADAVKAAEKAAMAEAKATEKVAAKGGASKRNADGVKKGGAKVTEVEEKAVPTPSASDEEEEDEELDLGDEDEEDDDVTSPAKKRVSNGSGAAAAGGGRRSGGRAAKGKVSYAEDVDEDVEMDGA